MLKIGCHLSVSGGFYKMGLDALSINANTFQFFTRNPRGGKAKNIDPKDIKKFLALATENGFGKLVAHAPYTLNPCSADERTREFAFETMSDDLNRMEFLPSNYYNFHPGSHVGQGINRGIELIISLLNSVLKPEQTTILLLETMSGKGSEIGGRFEEIKRIIDGVNLKDKIGVCIDTCHIYDAGYNIVDELDGVLSEFDSIIGLKHLKAVHLNDTMNPFANHKDRHQKIGKGFIGLETIIKIINNPRLRELPFILETPNELDGYASEINILRKAYT